MEIKYDNAKNGDRICSIDGIKLHSAYDPQKEAERFVSGLECSFSPTHIVITGPALSYCAGFLRKRFDMMIYGIKALLRILTVTFPFPKSFIHTLEKKAYPPHYSHHGSLQKKFLQKPILMSGQKSKKRW